MHESEPKSLRVQKTLDACIDRRIAGEPLPDEAIIAAYPELMPELADALVGLSVIERARRRARSSSSGSHIDRAGASQSPMGGPPDFLPGYEFLGEIHRGGQAVVYRAVHHSTRRLVAIKVAQASPLAGAHCLARFEREVEILGALRHPNIVTIHDSGTMAGGSFYYVMDYIEGRALDQWSAESKGVRGLAETVKLFSKVCDAVNAAHLLGIIHRDLKPANILVSPDGEPHVLDFGLAKMTSLEMMGPAGDTDSPSSFRSPHSALRTMTGQFVGSFPWASPEQADGSDPIDVRSDVYSLGVMLYHALSGRFPYEVTGSLPDVLNNIRHAQPAPLRQRAAGFSPALSRTRWADSRCTIAGVNPAARLIDDETETIVLKCLHKERERRYQSAGDLARDLRHYLAGEPIEAKRDSTFYILRKGLRRHRGAVSVACAVLLALTGFAVYAGFQAERQAGLAHAEREARQSAEAAREQAAAAQRDAESARENELDQRRKAEGEAAKAQAVVDFLSKDLLAAAAPEALGRDVTVRQVLDKASQNIEGRFEKDRLVQAAIHVTLGNTYRGLSIYDAARDHLEKALHIRRTELEGDHPETLASMRDLAALCVDQGRYDEAESLYVQTLDVSRRVLGENHVDTARCMGALALLHKNRGRYPEAERLYLETLALQRALLGEENPEIAESMHNLAVMYMTLGRFGEAEPLQLRALELFRSLFGEEHPHSIVALNAAGSLYKNMGRDAEAEQYYSDALERAQRVFGDEHHHTLTCLNNLAILHREQGRLDAAEAAFLQVYETRRRVNGEEHPDTLVSLNNLATLHRMQKRYAESETLHLRALGGFRRVLGDAHFRTATAMNDLGALYRDQHRMSEAEPFLVQAYEAYCGTFGIGHRYTLTAMNNLVNLYLEMGRYEEVEALGAAALRGGHDVLTDATWLTGDFFRARGVAQLKLKRYAAAEESLLEALRIGQATLAPDDKRSMKVVGDLVNLYEAWGNPTAAAEHRAFLWDTADAD